MLLTSSVLILKTKLEMIRATKNRAELYLCAQSYLKEVDSYISGMGRLNSYLEISYPLQFIPLPKISALMKRLHQLLKITQQAWHVSFMKNAGTLHRCHGPVQIHLATWSPYQTRYRLKLKRQLNGVVPLKDEIPKLFFFPGHYYKGSFYLQVQIALDSSTSRTFTMSETKEIPIADLWSLKQLYGLVSSHLLPLLSSN